MRRRALTTSLAVGLFVVLIAGAGSTAGQPGGAPESNLSGAVRSVLDAHRGVAPALLPNGLFVPAVSGGVANAVLSARGERGRVAARVARGLSATDLLPDARRGIYGCRNVFSAPGRPRNIRANVDCGF